MKIEITVRIDEALHPEIARELRSEAFEGLDVKIDSLDLEAFDYGLDDDDGIEVIAGMLIKIGNAIRSAASARSVFDLLDRSVERVVNKIPWEEPTSLVLETPDGSYDLVRKADRLDFKADLAEARVFDDPAELDRRVEALGGLINQRFDNA